MVGVEVGVDLVEGSGGRSCLVLWAMEKVQDFREYI